MRKFTRWHPLRACESSQLNTFLVHHFGDLYILFLDSVKWGITISLTTGRLLDERLNSDFAMANVYSTITLQSDISIYSHKLRSMKMRKTFHFHSCILWTSLLPGVFNGQHRLESSPQVFSDWDPTFLSEPDDMLSVCIVSVRKFLCE